MTDKSYQHKYLRNLTAIAETNSVPSTFLTDDEVEKIDFDYSIRAPGDFVISGPLTGKGGGPGKMFHTFEQAEAWARDKYGDRLKSRIKDAERGGRWAILVTKSG